MKVDAAHALVTQVLHGTYRIERLIGQGGMGAVFEATHLRLHHRVAVKIVDNPQTRDSASGSDFVGRFEREATLTAALKHPHIVEVIDFNVSEACGPYIVMELLEGESLAERLRVTPRLGAQQACSILLEIAVALEVAHQQGIVHRDLKPSNVFLCRVNGRSDFAKVLDFGIAKVLGSETIVTEARTRLGSAPYMSPEQLRGPEVDWRTDQFSLGTIAYEMLAGQRPFVADTDIAVAYQIEHKDPPPLEQLVPDLPVAAMEAVSRALSKKPERRFASIADFADHFAAALSDRPGAPAPPAEGTAESTATKQVGASSDAPTAGQTPLAKARQEDAAAARDAPVASYVGQPGRPRPRRSMLLVLASVSVLALASGALWWLGRSSPSGPPVMARVAPAEVGARVAGQAGDARAAGEDAQAASEEATPAIAPLLQPAPPARVPVATRRRLETACQRGNVDACATVGRRLERHGERDLAIAAYMRGCQLEPSRSCDHLGRLYVANKEYAAAAFTFAAACRSGVGVACGGLAGLHLAGQSGAKDVVAARKYYARGCSIGSNEACVGLALMYCPGGDLPTNLGECAAGLREACQRGSRRACSLQRQYKRSREARQSGEPVR